LIVLRRTAIAISVLAAIGGIVGYLVAGHLPILGVVGFLGVVASIVFFAFDPDRYWSQAEDLRRADQPEEHRMSEGPAPPFQS
jgi:hypothetical protein